MTFKPDPACSYECGDGACFRECKITCTRNYHDQLDCDLPLQTLNRNRVVERKSWWKEHIASALSGLNVF